MRTNERHKVLLLALALAGCGHARWPAKVLGDGVPIASKATRATIQQLLALPRPPGVDNLDAPRVPAETRVYTVQARLLRFTLASDGDIHLAIAEPHNESITMIAEIPDPDRMTNAPLKYRIDVARTRRAFVALFGEPKKVWRKADSAVELTGPVFFDLLHGQVGGLFGGAPTGVEIHPVLLLKKTLA